MKIVVLIQEDEDGTFVATCPFLPGCVSQGKTAREAEKNVRKAIRECCDARRKNGMIPLEWHDVKRIVVTVGGRK